MRTIIVMDGNDPLGANLPPISGAVANPPAEHTAPAGMRYSHAGVTYDLTHPHDPLQIITLILVAEQADDLDPGDVESSDQ